MTTTTTDTLSGPARSLADDARRQMHRRSHRGAVAAWLMTLDLDSSDALFDAVGGDNTAATALLLTEHRRGVSLATTVLLGAKARMLSAISRIAPGETREERFQVTVDAYLTRALARCKPDHPHVDAQLYWTTLRTVHGLGRRAADLSASERLCHFGPGGDGSAADSSGGSRGYAMAELAAAADVVVDVNDHLTASIVLDWAQSRGLLSERDRHALDVRFGGERVLPVREVALRMNVSEDSLETRLRRALRRLSDGVQADGAELRQACIAALWPQDDPADGAESALVA